MERFTIIYPERRTLSVKQVCVMFDDAIANGEIDRVWERALTPYKKAMELHKAGLITLSSDKQ